MKIFWSELFDDYFFEWNGALWLLYPDSSLDPLSHEWLRFQFTKPTDLKLITEVEA